MTGRLCTVGDQMLVQVIIPALHYKMGWTRGRKNMRVTASAPVCLKSTPALLN